MHSWTPYLRRLFLGLSVLGASGAASAASPQLGDATLDTAACCSLTTSLVNDVLRGKDATGDERFFSSEGAPPNIHFLVDLSGSMRELPQVINSEHSVFFDITVNGCENPRLDAFELSRGWNPATVYPVPDMGTALGGDNGFPNLFQDDKFYGYMYWTDSTNPPFQWTTKDQACQDQVGPGYATTDAAAYAQCLTCLSTKGYWKLAGAEGRDSGTLTNRDFIFWGRFLNFNPPKYVTAKAVLKSVIKDLRRVRAGISVFLSSGTLTALAKGQSPMCSAIATDASAFDPQRQFYISTVNSWSFSTGTPLAKSLLNVGYYFTSDDSIYRNATTATPDPGFGFLTNYAYPATFKSAAVNNDSRTVCWGCQTNSVIIITDGEPSGDAFTGTYASIASQLRALNGGPVYCPDSLPCNVGPLLSQRDKGIDPANPGDDNTGLYLDDVAKLLYTHDLQRNLPAKVGDFDTTGKQTLITYAVGFGINSNLLRNTAKVGGGLYYTADDASTLKKALLEIISNVETRATSFSNQAASTLQAHGASATLVPRFKPARSKTEPWQGLLYRFNVADERIQDCTPNGTGDLNRDGDCKDTLLTDSAGSAVIENIDGDFVKLLAPTTPAVPYWEAGKLLKANPDALTTTWKTRRIYTIVDSTGDNKINSADTMVEFKEANAATLLDALGISQNPAACSDLATQLGVASLTPVECAQVVIRWYRGADALNPDPAQRDYDRQFLLGDLFHSSPVTADPPVSRDFCDFSNQCIQSLYSGKTVMQSDYSTPAQPSGVTAYDKYVYEMAQRDQIALVGSNDGMLHAFLNGVSTGVVDTFTKATKHDVGTGQELWAFIPPDMLPKLRPNLGRHAYFVDGTPMVRDVWLDGKGAAADGKKQWEEYHTVAVVGSGQGGVHRFALDLTRLLGKAPNATASLVPQQGDFLWLWPQPCDPLALQVGESFTNFAPLPPPIGPVALTPQADDALRSKAGMSGSPETPYVVNATPARERYMVFFNGGTDQAMLRGKGLAVVDILTGHTVWSFFNGDGKGRSQYLRYPIAGGVGPMDIGKADGPLDGDYLFDTATVGDYGGQLWTVRFWQPGTWNAAKDQVDNWFAARSFRVGNLAGKTTDTEAVRAPFTYMTLNTMQQETGYLRTFIGTGDKQNLMDQGLGCRLSNPRACAAQGCDVNNTLTVKRGGLTELTSQASYQNYHYSAGTVSTFPAGKSCGGAQVTLAWDNNIANGCGNGNDGSIQYTCDGNSTTWSCRETANTWTVLNYVQPSTYQQRYYGVWTYGGSDPTRRFTTDSEADTYDSKMFTDTDLTNVGQYLANGDVDEGAQASAPVGGKGWYMAYQGTNERTASTGNLASGCVLVSSFEPSTSSGAVCSTTGTNKARIYQASYVTGRADCAAGFFDTATSKWKREIETTASGPPGEPVLRVSIGGGSIYQDIVTPSVGGGGGDGSTPTRNVTTTEQGVKSLYQMELDRRGHDCRHEGKPGACK